MTARGPHREPGSRLSAHGEVSGPSRTLGACRSCASLYGTRARTYGWLAAFAITACGPSARPEPVFPEPACQVRSTEPVSSSAETNLHVPTKLDTKPFRLVPASNERWSQLQISVEPATDPGPIRLHREGTSETADCPALTRVTVTGTISLLDGTTVYDVYGWVQLHEDGSLESYRLAGLHVDHVEPPERYQPAQEAIWSLIDETLPAFRNVELLMRQREVTTNMAVVGDPGEVSLRLEVRVGSHDADNYWGPLLLGRTLQSDG